jgi:hypothetical protein
LLPLSLLQLLIAVDDNRDDHAEPQLDKEEFQKLAEILFLGIGARVCMDIVTQYFFAPLVAILIVGPLFDYFLSDYLKFDGPWPESWDDELVALRLPVGGELSRDM